MRGKRYLKSLSLIDKNKIYTPEEAIDIVRQTSNVKFDATLELHLRLGIDVSKSEQNVRGSVALPYGSGKTKKVIAFVGSDKEKEAKEAGADIVGGEELIREIIAAKNLSPIFSKISSESRLIAKQRETKTQNNAKEEFGVVSRNVSRGLALVATPDMMPKLAKIAKILGPKGLMPNPKLDTVGANVKKMVGEQKAGKADFKNDATGNVHVVFGKISHDNSKLIGNFQALVSAIKKAKPSSSKGEFIKGAYICSTMGPSIKIAV